MYVMAGYNATPGTQYVMKQIGICSSNIRTHPLGRVGLSGERHTTCSCLLYAIPAAYHRDLSAREQLSMAVWKLRTRIVIFQGTSHLSCAADNVMKPALVFPIPQKDAARAECPCESFPEKPRDAAAVCQPAACCRP